MSDSKVNLSSLVVDESFHDRTKLDEDAIQRYAELYRRGKQKVLKVQRGTMKVVDGVHRYHAAQIAGIEKVEVDYIDVEDKDLRGKAYEFNRAHGIPYSTKERDEVIWNLRRADGWTVQSIADLVRLAHNTVSEIITMSDNRHGYNPEEAATRAETQPVIVRRLLAGETQQAVADDYGVSQPRIATIWGNWKTKAVNLYTSKKLKAEVAAKLGLTAEEIDRLLRSSAREDYEPTNFDPVYSSWWPPFGIDKRYGQEHKGNIPAALVQNILYFYTRPSAHVLDPFAGGGVVIDVCADMVGRTCEAFDLNPAREDIKFHNILDGPPLCETTPTFVFLDPPYGPIAKDKYGDNPDDLSNLSADRFVEVMGEIFDYWENAKLALLMCGMRKDGEYTDLPMLVGQQLQTKGWKILERIVNGIGQTESDNALWESKEKKNRLVLHRHIDIWIGER